VFLQASRKDQFVDQNLKKLKQLRLTLVHNLENKFKKDKLRIEETKKCKSIRRIDKTLWLKTNFENKNYLTLY
jgi:hypothetical protein